MVQDSTAMIFKLKIFWIGTDKKSITQTEKLVDESSDSKNMFLATFLSIAFTAFVGMLYVFYPLLIARRVALMGALVAQMWFSPSVGHFA